MAKYRAIVTYPDGYEEILEDLFDSEEEAREAALYSIGCWDTGAETLNMSDPGDYPYDENDVKDADYIIEEVEE